MAPCLTFCIYHIYEYIYCITVDITDQVYASLNFKEAIKGNGFAAHRVEVENIPFIVEYKK